MNDSNNMVILGVIVVILFIALIILTYKLIELQHKVSDRNLHEIHNKMRTVPKEELRPEQQEKEKPAEQGQNIIPGINLTEGISDINESMKRYSVKYNLISATMASMDGFSIASSHADSEKEAANLTARYKENAMTEIGDTHIITIKYRGEDILIIFRTTQQITREREDMMMRDGKSILSHWL